MELTKDIFIRFTTHFNSEPLLIFSPGRINLIGEHTDYNEGFAFPAAVDKGIALAINKSSGKTSTIIALDKNESYDIDLDNLKALENGGWRNYILGVVAGLRNMELAVENFEAVFAGNVPIGGGMSSSAALANAFVFGLNELYNFGLAKEQLILISQQAEHKYAGVMCGIMDQYASMFGEKDSALLLDCRTVTSTPYRIDLQDYGLMLMNSNIEHDLAETAYNDRRLVCESISSLLNVRALRDANFGDLDKIKSSIREADYRKALYVLQENNRVHHFSQAILDGDLLKLGNLMYESHQGLRYDYNVSCAELDFLVDQTKGNKDVLGARMMGGGFGGCTINLIKKSEQAKFVDQTTEAFRKKFKNDCSVYFVELGAGTRQM